MAYTLNVPQVLISPAIPHYKDRERKVRTTATFVMRVRLQRILDSTRCMEKYELSLQMHVHKRCGAQRHPCFLSLVSKSKI